MANIAPNCAYDARPTGISPTPSRLFGLDDLTLGRVLLQPVR